MLKELQKEFVFDHNPEAPSCHASTVLPLEGDRILAAWFAGSREGASDVGIWTSLYSAGRWTQPARLSSSQAVSHWNPVLHQCLDGTIVLYYKVGMLIRSWQTWFVTSRDGLCWSAPKELVPGDTTGGRGPVKNKCLRTCDGTWLAPASTEPSPEQWLAFIDCSRDDGFSWERQQLLRTPSYQGEPVGLIQPTLWEDAAGVHCLLRSNKGAIYRSDCIQGRWSTPCRTALPNNNSGIDLARDARGWLWLLYNPVGTNWGPRYPLALALSRDGGEHFENVLTLEEHEGEYSYPAIVARENVLYITYTYNRQKIAFWKLETREALSDF